ncbi:MAG: hypothetical protein HQK50_18645, partial [Oligoflexia bacterium]|nr:hypothetical protein [Oligoflexia bacterium]
LMNISGASVLDSYNLLAKRFLLTQGITASDFKTLAHSLFENYERTWRARGRGHQDKASADEKWFAPVSSLFRGVDCANPVVDFEGGLLLGSTPPHQEGIEVLSAVVETLPLDGPAAIEALVSYSHLEHALKRAQLYAGISLTAKAEEQALLLEVYSCFPVVPLAFLLKSKLIPGLKSAPAFLSTHAITVTGGMNLAKAPWNNPALHALVVMCEQLRHNQQIGLVHGNGGLGYKQGVAILRLNSPMALNKH